MSDLLYTRQNGSFTGYSVEVADILPLVEPVTLEEAKEYARIDGTVEDALITSLIKVARLHCESYSGKAFVRKTITVSSFSFPYNFQLPYGILESENDITKVVTIDEAGTETALEYRVNVGLYPKINILSGGQSYKFQIVYESGFTTAPDDVKLAIKMLVNTLYERREDFSDLAAIPSPLGVKALLSPYLTYNWFGA
jgi:uncharacterized phiE125 gp8 family phage protein